jgi:hypothetical protein
VVPHPIIIKGMIMALISIFLMAIEDEGEGEPEKVAEGS